MWWKKYRWWLVGVLAAAVVLTAAFVYGGDTPEPTELPETVGSPAAQETEHPEPKDSQPKEEDDPARDGSESMEPPADTPASAETPSERIESEKQPAEQPQEKPAEDNTSAPQLPPAEPAPETHPQPVEPQDTSDEETTYTCTISISCATVLDHLDALDQEKLELIPEDGWVLAPMEVTFYEGESVFNVLQRTCKQERIHMEFAETPLYHSAYIEGIHNLYEFECGELSGWMYQVNDWFPNYGCSRYQLKDGDVICWEYTCDLGTDIGGAYAGGTQNADVA